MTIQEIKNSLHPGDLQRIAEEAGVHPNTVANYLHRRHVPKPETEKKIMAAWAEIHRNRRAWKAKLTQSLKKY